MTRVPGQSAAIRWRTYWLRSTPKDPAQFDREVRAICDLYAQATTLHEQGAHVVSCDEKTGIQALERARATLPLRPGLVERIEYEYVRHGTLCLIANLDVATGRVENLTTGAHLRTQDASRTRLLAEIPGWKSLSAPGWKSLSAMRPQRTLGSLRRTPIGG